MRSRTISVMIACYNEASTLERAVEEALEALRSLPGKHEVIIVDDGSDDGSGAIADELSHRHDIVRTVHHSRNLGLGGFYRTSFKEARFELVYFMAADLQPIPGEYFPVYLPLFDDHDVVIGHNAHREAPWLSLALSRGEKLLFALLYPGVPKIGGPTMMKRSVIEAFDLVLAREDDRSWMVLWELVIRAKRAGFRFASVPIRGRPRSKGSSKGSTVRTAISMLRQLVALRRAFGG